MFRKYKDYKYACLNRKNFIISQLLTFVGNAILTLIILAATFFSVGYIYPLISAHIMG